MLGSTRPTAVQLRVASLIALVCACGPSAAPARAFELRIDAVEVHPVDGELPDEAEVRRTVAQAVLSAHALVDPQRRSAPALHARLGLGEMASSAGSRVLRVELEVAHVADELQAMLGARLDATVELERSDGTLVAAEDVPEALGRAVAVLDAKLSLDTGGEVEARRLLADRDPEIVVLALEHVARQRWRPLADDVAALLPGGDPRVTAAAVECLGEVGRPEHASLLLRSVRLADTAQAHRLYDALSLLGGDEAAAFLEFAARNEDDPALADVAERALRRLQRSPTGAAAEPVDPTLRGHRP